MPEQDEPVAVSATCTPPAADWNLQARWSLDDDDRYLAAHVGRYADGDGDGVTSSADPVGIWLTNPVGAGAPAVLVDATGEVVWRSYEWENSTAVFSTIAEVDSSSPGMEYLAASRDGAGTSHLAVLNERGGLILSAPWDGATAGALSLLDLEGDGIAEVLGTDLVASAVDGSVVVRFSGTATRPVTGDLDLDGFPEIISIFGTEPAVFDRNGALRGTCPVSVESDGSPAENTVFAIGNLDDDEQGEYAAANGGTLAICEWDGTLDASISDGPLVTDVLGLGEFDGDAPPELVTKYDRTDSAGAGIAVYDTDLRLIWRTDVKGAPSHLPFALADLDGDGLHEIVVNRDQGLAILSPTGELLAQTDEGPRSQNVFDAPIVTDLDGDGRAEILVSGADPNLTVFQNSEGGWPILGGSDPWPGEDHFPGDRTPSGALPAFDLPRWETPPGNTWQGLAPGAPELADLGIALAGTCAPDCDHPIVTIRLSNRGTVAAPGPIVLTAYSEADGEELASTSTEEPLPPGMSRVIRVSLPAMATTEPVRVEIDGDGRLPECQGQSDVLIVAPVQCG